MVIPIPVPFIGWQEAIAITVAILLYQRGPQLVTGAARLAGRVRGWWRVRTRSR